MQMRICMWCMCVCDFNGIEWKSWCLKIVIYSRVHHLITVHKPVVELGSDASHTKVDAIQIEKSPNILCDHKSTKHKKGQTSQMNGSTQIHCLAKWLVDDAIRHNKEQNTKEKKNDFHVTI